MRGEGLGVGWGNQNNWSLAPLILPYYPQKLWIFLTFDKLFADGIVYGVELAAMGMLLECYTKHSDHPHPRRNRCHNPQSPSSLLLLPLPLPHVPSPSFVIISPSCFLPIIRSPWPRILYMIVIPGHVYPILTTIPSLGPVNNNLPWIIKRHAMNIFWVITAHFTIIDSPPWSTAVESRISLPFKIGVPSSCGKVAKGSVGMSSMARSGISPSFGVGNELVARGSVPLVLVGESSLLNFSACSDACF